LLGVQVAEELAEVLDVGGSFELEAAAVRQILGKLLGAARAQGVDGRGLLLFHDHFVLAGRVPGFQPLPGQAPFQEVNQHVANGFQIVPAGLFDAQVVVDGRVTRGA
jgi:hypothetical protein